MHPKQAVNRVNGKGQVLLANAALIAHAEGFDWLFGDMAANGRRVFTSEISETPPCLRAMIIGAAWHSSKATSRLLSLGQCPG
ncbi:MAG: hypothetical protein V4812_13565 [Pseudomonadota bacterium]